MKPSRQMEAVEFMCGQGNFTSAFARAIVAATPPEQLEIDAGARGKLGNGVSEQLAHLKR